MKDNIRNPRISWLRINWRDQEIKLGAESRTLQRLVVDNLGKC